MGSIKIAHRGGQNHAPTRDEIGAALRDGIRRTTLKEATMNGYSAVLAALRHCALALGGCAYHARQRGLPRLRGARRADGALRRGRDGARGAHPAARDRRRQRRRRGDRRRRRQPRRAAAAARSSAPSAARSSAASSASNVEQRRQRAPGIEVTVLLDSGKYIAVVQERRRAVPRRRSRAHPLRARLHPRHALTARRARARARVRWTRMLLHMALARARSCASSSRASPGAPARARRLVVGEAAAHRSASRCASRAIPPPRASAAR